MIVLDQSIVAARMSRRGRAGGAERRAASATGAAAVTRFPEAPRFPEAGAGGKRSDRAPDGAARAATRRIVRGPRPLSATGLPSTSRSASVTDMMQTSGSIPYKLRLRDMYVECSKGLNEIGRDHRERLRVKPDPDQGKAQLASYEKRRVDVVSDACARTERLLDQRVEYRRSR